MRKARAKDERRHFADLNGQKDKSKVMFHPAEIRAHRRYYLGRHRRTLRALKLREQIPHAYTYNILCAMLMNAEIIQWLGVRI